MRRRDRDADGRADVERLAFERERLLERSEHLLRDACRAGLVGAGQQDRELVSAETRDRVRRAQARREARSDLLQQLVAHRVAEAVVHRLEVREVHHEHSDGLAGAWLTEELLLEALDEQRAIRQSGEEIVKELVLTLLT